MQTLQRYGTKLNIFLDKIECSFYELSKKVL